MNNDYKQGILSLIAGIALIILMIGIFSNILSFDFALFFALTLWILAGVGAIFFGVHRSGKLVPNAGWRRGVVALISSLGLIVLLAGIFLPTNQISFNNAFIIAIMLWVISGILASFLGVSKRNRPPYRYMSPDAVGYSTPYPPVSPSPPLTSFPQTDSYPKSNLKPHMNSNYSSDGPAKYFCP